MSEPIDALVYASIKNNLTSGQLSSTNITTTLNPPDRSKTADFMNSVLDKTVIKKACCINSGREGVTSDKYQVRVKIPVPKDYDYGSNPDEALWKKFGYIEKTVNVPKSLCSTLDKQYDYNTQNCQNFMKLYCENVKNFYKDELGTGKTDEAEFQKYSPECACFADVPKYLQKAGSSTPTIPPNCYALGCDKDNTNAFIPLGSRTACSATICTANLDMDSLKAGGNVNVNSKVTQNCGPQMSQDGAGTGGNSSGGNSSGGNSSGGNSSGGNSSGGNSSGGSTDSGSTNSSGGSTNSGGTNSAGSTNSGGTNSAGSTNSGGTNGSGNSSSSGSGSGSGNAGSTAPPSDLIMGMSKNVVFVGIGITVVIIIIIIILIFVLRKK